MIRAAAVACGLLLSGCAGALVQDDWHARPLHPALPPHHIEVAHADLPRICGNHPGMRLHGCAVRMPDARVCIIYTGPQPAAWLMQHERKHCAGWDHGPPGEGAGRLVAAASPAPGVQHPAPHPLENQP